LPIARRRLAMTQVSRGGLDADMGRVAPRRASDVMKQKATNSKRRTQGDYDQSRADILTVPEVAKLLRCHEATVYRMLKRKEIPAFKVGADWRFMRSAIEEWARSQSSAVMAAAEKS
jgi:excisionase family DNA binding protein